MMIALTLPSVLLLQFAKKEINPLDILARGHNNAFFLKVQLFIQKSLKK